jgi:hypothetical protein
VANLYNELVNFLYDECEDANSTADVDALLAFAKEQIFEGKGTISSLTNSGVNGKSFSRVIHLDPVLVANACRAAKKIFTGVDDEITTTYPDFRSITH